MKRFLAALAVLSIAATAAAEPYFGDNAVCRVRVECGTKYNPVTRRWEKQFSHGTGVVVRKDLVLTNSHVVDGCQGLIGIRFPDGAGEVVEVVASNQTWDLAALRMNEVNDRVPKKIAEAMPELGEPLFAGGYGGTNKWKNTRGEMLGWSSPQNVARQGWIRVSESVRRGDSGGPIVNVNGELVGLIWGTSWEWVDTSGVSNVIIREFLEGVP